MSYLRADILKSIFKGLTGRPVDDYQKPFLAWAIHELKRPFTLKFKDDFIRVHKEFFLSVFHLLCLIAFVALYPVGPFFTAAYHWHIKRKAWKQFGIEQLLDKQKKVENENK
jgi:hypothetical protein